MLSEPPDLSLGGQFGSAGNGPLSMGSPACSFSLLLYKKTQNPWLFFLSHSWHTCIQCHYRCQTSNTPPHPGGASTSDNKRMDKLLRIVKSLGYLGLSFPALVTCYHSRCHIHCRSHLFKTMQPWACPSPTPLSTPSRLLPPIKTLSTRPCSPTQRQL